jgi:sugar lactone lactonase YvrE
MSVSAGNFDSSVAVEVFATGFRRPESVHFLRDGSLLATDVARGYRRVSRAGDLLEEGPPLPAGVFPNGIMPEPDGTLLLADLGDHGGIWRLAEGTYEPLSADPVSPRCNFVVRDPSGRLWVTVSTWREPRSLAYRPDHADGAILRLDPLPGSPERWRVVLAATRLHYPNELAFSPDGSELMVNETMAFRTSIFTVQRDGSLRSTGKRVEYSRGDFCDGITVDARGRWWVTCIVSNRLYCVEASRAELVLDDGNTENTRAAVLAFESGRMDRRWFDHRPPGAAVGNMTSLALAPSGDRAALGCIVGDAVHMISLEAA